MENEKTKYQELIDYIQDKIESGEYVPGQKLPSENEWRIQFGISRQTIRKAISILEGLGLVRRVRGSGTYLCDRRKESINKCKQVAVITTYVDCYIFPRIIQGIEKQLSERGYSVQISFTNNTLERERSVLLDIISRDDVEGVIVEGTKSGLPNPNILLYQKLIERRIPIVFINTFYPELDVPHVSLDDVKAAHKAVNYLIENGHRNIGAVLKLDDGQGRQRYLGYLQAMYNAGLMVTDSSIIWIDTEEYRQLTYCKDKIMNRIGSCSAFFCYNDEIAFQLISTLREKGISVPEQVSVISVDDADLAIHSVVPITTLPHPKEKLGVKAAELLLRIIDTGKKAESYEFDTEVVERSSVMHLPHIF